VPVVNRFFGPSVTVSGLLTGADLGAEFGPSGRVPGDIVVVPHWMFDPAGERTLDGVTPAEIETALGRPLWVVASLADLIAALGRPAGTDVQQRSLAPQLA
jgi:NifB/MoaA-like Fe-S oxidoreductase